MIYRSRSSSMPFAAWAARLFFQFVGPPATAPCLPSPSRAAGTRGAQAPACAQRAAAAVRKQLALPRLAVEQVRCLTPRSSGEPTACRLAREAALVIIGLAGQSSHRRLPLSSNVRPHRTALPSARSRLQHVRLHSRSFSPHLQKLAHVAPLLSTTAWSSSWRSIQRRSDQSCRSRNV